MDFQEYSPPIKYGATIGSALANSVGGALTFDSTGTGTLRQGSPFVATVSFGTTEVQAGNITILADSALTNIGSGKKVYVENIFITESATPSISWINGSTTSLVIKDSAGTLFATIQTSALTAQAVVKISSGSISAGTAMAKGTGGTANKGLVITGGASSGTLQSGNNATVTVWGIIK